MKNNKFLNFIKKFPVIISTIIVAPALIYTGRYLLTDEYYFYNFFYEGEKLNVEDETFQLTKINKVANVYQAAALFSYQGGACYQNYYAICTDSFEAVIIYNTKTMKIEHIINTGIVNTDWHCNQMFFGNDFYSAHDKFPLLYISMESPKVHSTMVFRIYQNGGLYYITNIQNIELGFDTDEGPIYFPNSYYDYDDGIIYYGGYTNNSYMKSDDNKLRFYTFTMPDYRLPDTTIYTSQAIDTFELPSETATQGGFISHHHLYQTFSFNSKTDPLKAPKMRVVNLETKTIIKDYQNLGEQFGVYEEFEHVAVDNDNRIFALGNPYNIYEFEYKAVIKQ